MKRTIIVLFLTLYGCSTSERSDWDSGAAAQNAYQQERQEEQTSTTREQFPETGPATENVQPF